MQKLYALMGPQRPLPLLLMQKSTKYFWHFTILWIFLDIFLHFFSMSIRHNIFFDHYVTPRHFILAISRYTCHDRYFDHYAVEMHQWEKYHQLSDLLFKKFEKPPCILRYFPPCERTKDFLLHGGPRNISSFAILWSYFLKKGLIGNFK